MKVLLLRHTPEPEMAVAQAAKLCYSATGVEAIAEKLTPEKTAEFVRRIVAMGHWSALEHAVFTFGAEGISRALTHQLVRHRLASYSQQSQRYVANKNFTFVLPPTVAAKPEAESRFRTLMAEIAEGYAALLASGLPAEDARYVLPNACETKIVITMNARELSHFFRLRCCRRAQWEIRNLAESMLALAVQAAPALFPKAGPGCVAGPCPEGEFSCGQAAEVREQYRHG